MWLSRWLENNLSERTSGAHFARLLGFTLLLHDKAADAARAARELGLKWGEYYVPDDMLDQLTDDGDASEGSDEDKESMEEEEEAEAEEEAVPPEEGSGAFIFPDGSKYGECREQ